MSDCVAGELLLDFGRSRVEANDLGGHGPDHSSEDQSNHGVIRYAGIASIPAAAASAAGGGAPQLVDLIVSEAAGLYRPGDAHANGGAAAKRKRVAPPLPLSPFPPF